MSMLSNGNLSLDMLYEVVKVNTVMSLTILLLNRHNISHLIRLMYKLDKANIQELLNLLFDLHLELCPKVPQGLLTGLVPSLISS